MLSINSRKRWVVLTAPLAIAVLSSGLSGCGNGSSTPVKVIIGSNTGTRIVFNNITGSNLGLYTMSPDGTGSKRITDGTKLERSPSISPDGKRIVFAATSPSSFFISNVDGSSQVAWTAPSSYSQSFTPSYGFSGTRVVFVGDANLFTADEYGNGVTRVTSFTTGDILTPSYSPDAKKILFTRKDPDGSLFVCTIGITGIGAATLTPAASKNFLPRYTPDGTKIIFVSNRNGNNQIYSMKSDGTLQTRLTNNATNDTDPIVSPDGTKIAFYSDRETTGSFKVYTMNIDGTGQTKASDLVGDGVSLDWK